MLRFFTKLFCFGVLALGVQRASAFSLLGNYEVWQTPIVSFRVGGQLGGSRNLGDEYRINTPLITYGFDSSFLDYFGSNGVRAVEQAIALLNKLPRASQASADLNEFLTDDAQRIHQTAQALNLIDLKSTTLGLLIEHMGLYGEDHVFDLRQRIPLPASCQFAYTVIVRNFDPVTYEPSHYVNGTLYTYQIIDGCPAVAQGDALETLVDPTDFIYNAVASAQFGLQTGGYYINITRDDMGGLRYLYRRNNYNNEVLPPDAVVRPFSGPWQPVDFFQTNSVVTNSAALRGGIEKIRFQKSRFDSLLGTSFKPIVHNYTVPIITNFSVFRQSVRRVILQPDILFTAGDIGPSDPSAVAGIPIAARSISFATNSTSIFSVNGSGPGTIIPQMLITFNKVGPFFQNITDFFLDEATATKGFLWGSFDGSTNDPVVYPQGTSIRDLERQILRP